MRLWVGGEQGRNCYAICLEHRNERAFFSFHFCSPGLRPPDLVGKAAVDF